jgi:hypothetical protein
MPKHTPAQVKNAIRRALRTVVDPELKRKQIDELWAYFGAACAYCGKPLDRSRREGQADHLVPTAAGGSNHLANRVLSCGPCNGDHKREREWREFLAEKVLDAEVLQQRVARIELWNAAVAPGLEAADLELLESETARALEAFDSAVEVLRRAGSK